MADGIYNNMYFMHAATSHVGNTVQVQTKSGATFEGVFRTFSSQFQVILELAHKVDNNPNEENKICVDSVVEKFIIKPSDIVSISAKDVDLDYPTRDTFQTDTAITRCNGSLRNPSSNRLEDRELEPWDGLSGINGDTELIELDGNSNGWDVNEMFTKNETVYGVQSTFDQSLSGYTMPIQKDTQEFKEQEAEAEKIAQEIEQASGYRERTEMENGDEELKYAAVERMPEPNPEPQAVPKMQTNNNNNPNKFVSQIKRKPINPTAKLMVRTPPPNNGNHVGPPQQQSNQVSIKTNNYPSMAMQSQVQNVAPPPQYVHGQPTFSHIHSQPPPSISVAAKMNGEAQNNSTSKPMPQRMRQYQPASAQVTFTEPPPAINQPHLIQNKIPALSMKPPIHVQHAHVVSQHMQQSALVQDGGQGQPQQTVHVVAVPQSPHLHVVVPQPHVVVSATPPPQPQRQPRSRDEQVQEFRKFHTNFTLQQPPSNVNGGATSGGPSQSQQTQQQNVVQNHHSQQQDVIGQPNTIIEAPLSNNQKTQIMQHNDGNSGNQQSSQQAVNVTAAGGGNNNNSGGSTGSNSSTPPQQQTVNSSTNTSNNDVSTPPEKAGVGAKKFVLNPAAKPFTPRSPSTPNPSRPHTPQTPGPSVLSQQQQQGQYQPVANHAAAAAAVAAATQPQMMVPYSIVQPPTFQTPQHPHAGQQTRFRKNNLMQIQNVTGQPLLAPPLQQFVPFPQAPHPQHFQSQPYQPMVRMFHESPPQPQLQYLTPTPPSTTPSPGQPHQQYHPGPQPSPAGGGPQAYAQAAPQATQFQMFPLIPPGTQLVPQYFQGAVQQQHHPQSIQVLMQQHPAQ